MAGKITGTGMGAAGTAFDFGVTALTGVVSGSILTKVELAINFFQVYGLFLSLPLTFEWPEGWVTLAEVYTWFAGALSVDVDAVLETMSVPVPTLVKKYLSFLAMMILMVGLLILYLYASLMHRQAWLVKYVRKWPETRRNAIFFWLATVAVSLIVGVAFDWSGTVGNAIVRALAPARCTCPISHACPMTYTGVLHAGWAWPERSLLRRDAVLHRRFVPVVLAMGDHGGPVSHPVPERPGRGQAWRSQVPPVLVQDEAVDAGAYRRVRWRRVAGCVCV